jgi:hypothetical protein
MPLRLVTDLFEVVARAVQTSSWVTAWGRWVGCEGGLVGWMADMGRDEGGKNLDARSSPIRWVLLRFQVGPLCEVHVVRSRIQMGPCRWQGRSRFRGQRSLRTVTRVQGGSEVFSQVYTQRQV